MDCRIAICDDNTIEAEYVRNVLNSWAFKRQVDVHTKVFPSAESFLFRYAEDKTWDVLLLDIEMGAMDGVALAKRIRRDNETVQIIFITGYSDYIAEGYEVAALHYLMKPVKEDKLFAALDRALSTLRRTEPVLLLQVEGEMVRLPVSQIQYVEAFSHSVTIATETDTIQTKKSISQLEKMLSDDGFVRCHRSYLVSLKCICRISKSEILLDSGKRLPLSRSASQAVHKAFIAYYKGEDYETV